LPSRAVRVPKANPRSVTAQLAANAVTCVDPSAAVDDRRPPKVHDSIIATVTVQLARPEPAKQHVMARTAQ
jgi:hypothetical protein